MALSHDLRAKDRSEAIQARKQAAALLRQAVELVRSSRKKLAYQKGESVNLELDRIVSDINDVVETLEDPGSIPQ
jgi:hypothetical protein